MHKSRPLKLLLILVAALAVLIILWLTDIIKVFHKHPVVRAPSAPLSVIPSSTTDKTSTSTLSDKNSSVPTNSVNQGSDTDKNGRIPSSVTTNESQWSTSQSGVITVQSPAENSKFSSGDVLAGTAAVKQVQYTLIDNQYGVISQGFINVVNGKFSAAINYSSHSTSGRLDVFSTDSNGREVNEIQIDVNF